MANGFKERGEPALPESLREEFRSRLAVCLSIARVYDGTEATYQRLVESLAGFEDWQHATFAHYFGQGGERRLDEAAESVILRTYHPTLAASSRTVSGLLGLAGRRFAEALSKQKAEELLRKIAIRKVGGAFFPPGKRSITEQNGTHGSKEEIFFPRLRVLIGALQEKKVFLDDILLWEEDEREAQKRGRQVPYTLVEIPRIGRRQLMVCDQVGEATFVSTEPLDPKTFLTTS